LVCEVFLFITHF